MVHNQELIEDLLNRVLDYYDGHSLTLDERPSLVYFDRACKKHPIIAARVADEFEGLERAIDLISERFSEVIWSKVYGLDISNDALIELTAKSKEIFMECAKKTSSERNRDEEQNPQRGEIFVYNFFNELERFNLTKEEILVHEVWHLIERDRGVIGNQPFIIEGTATYMQERFGRKRRSYPLKRCENMFDAMYSGCGFTVKSILEWYDNPFSAVFDNKLRDYIQEVFLGQLKSHLPRLVEANLNDVDFRKFQAEMLMGHESYRELENDLSVSGILRFYERIGAHRFLEEVKGQDLTRLLNYFKRIFS